MVKELDKAAENWKRLGFTISPRGTHSAHMGSGNYTIMFDPDYMELLGVLTETEHNAPARAFLAKHGDGIERVAFTAVDSAAGAEEIRARGFAPIGPTDFERPVTMPDGKVSAAKFRTFQWPTAEAPGGVRIFACQHKTRETVWIPELMKHANGAKRLRQVLIATPEPAKDAAHLGRMIDREARNERDGAVAVPSGSDRAEFIFLTRQQLAKRYPDVVARRIAGTRRRRPSDRGRSRGDRKGVGFCSHPQRRAPFASRRLPPMARCWHSSERSSATSARRTPSRPRTGPARRDCPRQSPWPSAAHGCPAPAPDCRRS